VLPFSISANGSAGAPVFDQHLHPPPGGDVEKPVAGGSVTLTGDGITRSLKTTDTGTFTFSGLAPSRYVLKAGACAVPTTVSVSAGKPTQANLLCFEAVG
jgi:hypothetical protein